MEFSVICFFFTLLSTMCYKSSNTPNALFLKISLVLEIYIIVKYFFWSRIVASDTAGPRSGFYCIPEICVLLKLKAVSTNRQEKGRIKMIYCFQKLTLTCPMFRGEREGEKTRNNKNSNFFCQNYKEILPFLFNKLQLQQGKSHL